MPSEFPALPVYYYHDHFMEMIDFVERLYRDCLKSRELDFIRALTALPHHARCLYIRMMNRKRPLFYRHDLRYEEIENIAEAERYLRASGFIREIRESDYKILLQGQTKEDLLDLARSYHLDSVKSAWTKPRLVAAIAEQIPFEIAAGKLEVASCLVPDFRDVVRYLLFLYFGRLNESLTGFTLRDLGVVAVKAQPAYKARFSSAEEAQSAFFYTEALRRLKDDPSDAASLADRMVSIAEVDTPYIADLKDKLLILIGRAYEKNGEIQNALHIYRQGHNFEIHERLVRLLYAQGEKDEARQRLEAMAVDPASDEEYVFAIDFLARKFGQTRIGIHTSLLQQAETITADDLYRSFPEEAAIAHYADMGWQAYHIENGLWPALFALVFWPELFEGAGYGSGFDHVPVCLSAKSFHQMHATQIADKLKAIRQGQLGQLLQEIFISHRGKDNGIFVWSDDLEELMTNFAQSTQGGAVAHILEKMSADFYGHCDGFPDLMLCRDGDIRFVEVKAPGDALRKNQLGRLRLLREAGFHAEILRIEYSPCADQVYTVVDVETTGRAAPYGRVTEIAAVKIRNGQVVSTWESLVNPECRIPAMITGLTGISDDMVKSAPVFANIADSLHEFLQGSIFVAHNASFDHGMLASEFRRLEKKFRYPKFCTCAEMRRHYPGLGSYSLANLCREFAIPLHNHHRAMADATAAAELLKLINEKRLAA